MRVSLLTLIVLTICCLIWTERMSALQLTSSGFRQPNIVLVMPDDQGMGDLSCMGNTVLRTPRLDEFCQRSMRFTDFHVSPTCAPTRSALLSGRHEFRNGVTHTINERERMSLDTTTFPQLLKQAGYATGIFGKWHLGDEDAYQPYNRGFDEVFIHGAGGIGQNYKCSCADFPPNTENRYFDVHALHNDTIVRTEGFCTDVFFAAATDWIDKRRNTGEPFFAMIAPNAPHSPMIAPEENKKRFLELGYDQTAASRYGMIENIDENFGKLIQQLDDWQMLESTLVIFMTDNGQSDLSCTIHGKKEPMFNAGFRTGKGTVYEGGTHVPAFWHWRGVTPDDTDVAALAAHIDLFPTFCELAGVAIDDNIQSLDGRSLCPLIRNPEAEWKDRHLFIHLGRWKQGTDPNLAKFDHCAVRTSRWRMVNNRELYDIQSDPKESTDVFADHPEVVAELRAAYDQWWTSTVPLMVNENVPLSTEQPQVIRYEKQLKERGIPVWKPGSSIHWPFPPEKDGQIPRKSPLLP